MNSHMIKNSEWGAVAYLTHSIYGRNRNEIEINTNNLFYTGGGSGTAYIVNTAQSTTGNTYGVYDMSGGAYEHLAAYNCIDNNNYIKTYGWLGLTSNVPSTRYATKYYNTTATKNGSVIYTTGKIGDATKETYLGTSLNWNDDNAGIANAIWSWFRRGGNSGMGLSCGVFCCWDAGGNRYNEGGFRSVLCVRITLIYGTKILYCNKINFIL